MKVKGSKSFFGERRRKVGLKGLIHHVDGRGLDKVFVKYVHTYVCSSAWYKKGLMEIMRRNARKEENGFFKKKQK